MIVTRRTGRNMGFTDEQISTLHSCASGAEVPDDIKEIAKQYARSVGWLVEERKFIKGSSSVKRIMNSFDAYEEVPECETEEDYGVRKGYWTVEDTELSDDE